MPEKGNLLELQPDKIGRLLVAGRREDGVKQVPTTLCARKGGTSAFIAHRASHGRRRGSHDEGDGGLAEVVNACLCFAQFILIDLL